MDERDAGSPTSVQGFPDNLLTGYRNFMRGRFSEQQKRYKALAESGQKPTTMVIACCDSPRRARNDLRRRPGRTLRRAQRRQPDAALRAGRALSLDIGGA